MKKFLSSLLILTFIFSAAFAQRRMENLDQGLLACKVSNGVYVNWRITAQEWRDVSYKLYRDNTLIKTISATEASNYVDTSGTLSSKYKVAAVIKGIEQTASPEVGVQPNPWIEITLEPIPRIPGVDDSYYENYKINDIVTADLDGDGAYDYIVKRINNAMDANDRFANKYYTLFDAYKSDGTFMWRIDVGPNLMAHEEINALVFDFDGDGKAEVVMRTSEGTVDGTGYMIPDLGNAMGQPIPDGKTNYRDKMHLNNSWYEYEGPEYLSLFDGETGQMLDRIDHIARQPVEQWGSSGMSGGQLAHRATKYHYGAPYLDGKNPSVLVTRGIYHRTKMVTYDIIDKKFVKRWDFDSADYDGYSGQGNHNYSIADVDNDGRDEIVYGSMTVDDDGKGLYTTRLGHGDAMHVSDLDPYRKGLEVFACLESSPYYGTTLRAAESGDILLQYIAGGDEGRCIAANVSDNYLGAELLKAGPTGVYSSATTKQSVAIPSGSQNYRIYWDGDLLEELVNHNWNASIAKGEGTVSKLVGNSWKNVLTTSGYFSCNHTKGTPCLQADLFGDWREELIFRSDDDTKIRIYFTTDPTEYRIYTLMHDSHYRQAIAWQMCGYNQPPHTGFFLGELERMTIPPPPVNDNDKYVFDGSGNMITTSSWTKNRVPASLQSNADILLDVSGHVAGAITINSDLSPKTFTVNSPEDYTLDFSTGKLSGSTLLIKQGKGKLTFNGNHDYTGDTELWDGLVELNGQLPQSSVQMKRFSEFSIQGNLGKDLLMEYGSVLFPAGQNSSGTLQITGQMHAHEGAIIEFDLSNQSAACDKIQVGGALQLEDQVIFSIKTSQELNPGTFELIQASSIQGDLSKIIIQGLETQINSLSIQDNTVILTVSDMRAAASVLWKGDKDGAVWDIADTKNFILNGTDTYFSVGDEITIDDSAVSKTINKAGNLFAGDIHILGESNFVIQGEGIVSGTGTLTKTGDGKLTLLGTNEYTGATIINGGILSVESMPNLDFAGSIGFSSNDPNQFVLNGATLTPYVSAITTTQALKIGENGATINATSNISWDALITGNKLTKTGASTLSLFGKNTSLDTLVIVFGNVTLKTEDANTTPAKNIVFEGGTLNTVDGSGSFSNSTFNMVVRAGKTGTINLDSRCIYTGKLSGAGTLNIKSPYVRCDQNGNWVDFSGTLNFTGDDIRLNNANVRNLKFASVNLASGTKLYAASNGGGEVGTSETFTFGALSGSGGISGKGNLIIGDKGLNTTYSGVISAGAGKLTKRGTGNLTLSGSNLYTGGTIIEDGALITTNSTGSATGSGVVTVKNSGLLVVKGNISGAVMAQDGGRVSGTSNIANNVTIAVNSFLEPGDESAGSAITRLGKLTLDKNLTLSGTLKLGVRNAAGYQSDKLVVKGNATLNGNLEVEAVSSGSDIFPLGAKLSLLDLQGNVNGNFTQLILPETEEGTSWDTSKLLTDGTIEVVVNTAIKNKHANAVALYPNPANAYILVDYPTNDTFNYEIIEPNGSVIYASQANRNDKIDVSFLQAGLYFIRIMDKNQVYKFKLIIK